MIWHLALNPRFKAIGLPGQSEAWMIELVMELMLHGVATLVGNWNGKK
jgi:hypothetical protein